MVTRTTNIYSTLAWKVHMCKNYKIHLTAPIKTKIHKSWNRKKIFKTVSTNRDDLPKSFFITPTILNICIYIYFSKPWSNYNSFSQHLKIFSKTAFSMLIIISSLKDTLNEYFIKRNSTKLKSEQYNWGLQNSFLKMGSPVWNALGQKWWSLPRFLQCIILNALTK